MIAWECVCMLVVSSSGAKAFSPPAAYSEPGWWSKLAHENFLSKWHFLLSMYFCSFFPLHHTIGPIFEFCDWLHVWNFFHAPPHSLLLSQDHVKSNQGNSQDWFCLLRFYKEMLGNRTFNIAWIWESTKPLLRQDSSSQEQTFLSGPILKSNHFFNSH